MADFFCDHENSTLYTTALMAAPVWGQAQDGDGTVNGAGDTPIAPIGSVVFSAISATPTAGGVSILGSASIVPAYAATRDAQANNLATAINASAAAVTLTTNAGNIASAYVKALVYARGPAGGAPAGTCEVMSRIATGAFNTGTNIAVTAWTNVTATPSDMRSGVSGPWRYLFTVAALASNVSSAIGAAGTYGGCTATLLGAITSGDNLHVRTKRAGSDITIAWPGVSLAVSTRNIGTFQSPFAIIFDNGIKWAGDAGVMVWTMDASLTVNRSFTMPATAGCKQRFIATRLTDTTCNWRVELSGVPNLNYYAKFGANAQAAASLDISGFEISGPAGAAVNNTNQAYSYVVVSGPAASIYPRETAGLLLTDSVFKQKGMRTFIGSTGAAGYGIHARVEDCLFDHTGLSVAADQAMVGIAGTLGSGVGTGRLEYHGCRFTGFPAAANLSGAQTHVTQNFQLLLKDCTTTNIKLSGGVANGGIVGATEGSISAEQLSSISVVSSNGNRNFVFENRRQSFAWIDSAAPRTGSSLLPDGVTNFSVRTAVTTEVNNVTKAAPVRFPTLAKLNTLANGTRTATLRLLVDNNLRTALGGRDPKNDELWVVIGYIGTDGNPKRVSTSPLLTSTPASLTAGTAANWSAVSYDVNGVTHNYTAFEISATLTNVKTLTDLSLVVHQGFYGSSVDDLIFLDPEWALV